VQLIITKIETLIAVNKYRVTYLLSIQNEEGDEIEIDDEAHSRIQSHAEIRARADVLRAATGWQIDDRGR
jgi:hypothetical protein